MTALFNMLPRAPFDDVEHVRDGDAKPSGYIFVDHSITAQFTYFADIGFGQVCAAVLFAVASLIHKTGSHSVAYIFRLGAPLQVLRRVVQLIAVDMIGDVLLRRSWSAESLKHKTMNNAHRASPVLREADHQITPGSQVLGQNPLARSSKSASNPYVFADDCPHTSMIGDFVRVLKANNRFPSFVFHACILGNSAPKVNLIRS